KHARMATIYGLEEAGAVHAIVMELIDGEPLAQRVVRGPIAPADALPIARQIADAIDAAHEKGIVHRDLKPGNIAITRDGLVKVLDFGLAKVFRPAETGPNDLPTATVDRTREGLVVGTAAYMSPEQARGQTVDKR